MHLAELLAALAPLLDDPAAHWESIVTLVQRHRALPEYEVARCLITVKIRPAVDALLDSADPRERLVGVRTVAMIYGRAQAAQALRHRVRDPHRQVAGAARAAVKSLHLEDAWPFASRSRAPFVWNERHWRWHRHNSALGWRYERWPALASAPRREPPGALPKIETAGELAAFLGLPDEGALRRWMRPGAASGSAYVEFEVPKASGGSRRIATPRPELKRIQQRVLREILDRVAAHASCHGFVRGRSVVTNATPHARAAVVVKTDLREFFPSVHYRRVRGFFERLGYSREVGGALAGLTTYRPKCDDGEVAWPGVLAQGAPTSPALANLVCLRLDARLSGLAAKVGAVYTRYADDMTFSFVDEPAVSVGRFLWWVDQICQDEGFVENTRKRRVLRRCDSQRVTGVVVNSGASVPREARRRFRAILQNCRVHGIDSQARGHPDFRGYLRGFAAWVQMVQPERGAKLVAEVQALLAAETRP